MRIAKWDNAKFLLIFCVVFGHLAGDFVTENRILNGLTYFVYLFHVPAFLFLSGMFSKKSIRELRYDKALAYFVLYFFIKAVRFLVRYYYLKDEESKFFLFTEGNTPWFALVIMLCYLVTMLIRKWNPVYSMVVFVCLGMMIGYDSRLDNMLSGTRFFTFYPFFLAGYYIEIEKLQKITQSLYVKIVSCVVMLSALWLSFSRMTKRIPIEFLKGRDTYREVRMLDWGGLYRGGYYIAVMVLIVCFLALVPSVKTICTTWGSRTMQVYALHIPVLLVLVQKYEIEKVCQNVFGSYYGYAIPVLALLITVILSLKIWESLFKAMMNPTKGGNKIK